MNKRLTFIRVTNKRVYNPDLGEYEEGETSDIVRPCTLIDLGVERSMRIFGDYQQTRKVAIIQQPYRQTCHMVKVDGVVYKVIAVKQNGKVWYLERDNVEIDV